ncbi:hypothetical protein SDC9_87335 [bioreactor metagenome]|uniref:Uncharacterized protein n=1 Tax=bioreactor metagenome TaxID=1076179 RepID=A0A644ZIM9_9ZZZZ
MQFWSRRKSRYISDTNNFIPNIQRLLYLGTPLTEIITARIRNQAICRYYSKLLPRWIIGFIAFQNKASIFIYFESHTFTILIKNVFRTIIDCVFKHLNRRRIEGGINSAPFTNSNLYFGNCGKPAVKSFKIIDVLFNTCMWHAGRHEQITSFIEGWHEFLARSRKGTGGSLPDIGLPKRCPADFLETGCNKANYFTEALPYQKTEYKSK